MQYVEKLDRKNFAINLCKCHFNERQIISLVCTAFQAVFRPRINKTSAIKKLGCPKTDKKFKSLLGSVRHVSKYVPKLTKVRYSFGIGQMQIKLDANLFERIGT